MYALRVYKCPLSIIRSFQYYDEVKCSHARVNAIIIGKIYLHFLIGYRYGAGEYFQNVNSIKKSSSFKQTMNIFY